LFYYCATGVIWEQNGYLLRGKDFGNNDDQFNEFEQATHQILDLWFLSR